MEKRLFFNDIKKYVKFLLLCHNLEHVTHFYVLDSNVLLCLFNKISIINNSIMNRDF